MSRLKTGSFMPKGVRFRYLSTVSQEDDDDMPVVNAKNNAIPNKIRLKNLMKTGDLKKAIIL